jgi:hypothetical protein
VSQFPRARDQRANQETHQWSRQAVLAGFGRFVGGYFDFGVPRWKIFATPVGGVPWGWLKLRLAPGFLFLDQLRGLRLPCGTSRCEVSECPGVVGVDRFTVASFLLLFSYLPVMPNRRIDRMTVTWFQAFPPRGACPIPP